MFALAPHDQQKEKYNRKVIIYGFCLEFGKKNIKGYLV